MKAPRRGGGFWFELLLDDELGPDSIDVTDAERIRHLQRIVQRVIKDTDKDATKRKQLWMFWFFLYLIWWESEGLKRRVQRGTGPARGIIQMEPQTLWDVLKRYVLKEKDRVANLAKAAGVSEDEMEKALKGFVERNKTSKEGEDVGKNEWPEPPKPDSETPPPPEIDVEGWLRSNDTFAVKLLRYFFKWHGDEHLPPDEGTDEKADPTDDEFKKQFAKDWGEGYNRGPEGKKKQSEFVEKAKGLDKALKN
ncbi:MAG TPA: hypothetical protein VFF73_06035 [Planctomycetota bacterium]|nr:hypothetical protein [Planctomycetota bacterium]